jgi:hypothetical protein
MQRVNFTAELVGDVERPGIKDLLDRLQARGGRTPEQIVDDCLDLMGPLEMNPNSRQGLIGFVEHGGDFHWDNDEQVQASTARVSELLQLIVATREYQFA